MSKIAIISQPDQGVLIDVGGCASMQEAVSHLSSTLQVSSQFWKGVNVALNLGELELTSTQVAHILALAKGVGVYPYQVFAQQPLTRGALLEHGVVLGDGKPMTLPAMTIKVPENPTDEDWVDESVNIDSIDENSTVTVFYEPSENQLITEEVEQMEQGDQVAQDQARADGPEAQVDFTPNSETEKTEKTEKPSKAAKAKEKVEGPVHAGVMYLRQTLRSGQSVSHTGHLVIIGDVNPGAEVVAEGDITVWGALRGIARAGCSGNNDAEIRALRLQPIQIRIGESFARSPDKNRLHYDNHHGPETARVVDGKIKVFKFNPQF
jgi:septum site-determining protein MinC